MCKLLSLLSCPLLEIGLPTQKIFWQDFNSSYSRDIFSSETALAEEFQPLSLLSVALEDVESLEAPISVLEIEAAVGSLANNKTLGPVGLPGEFYKTYASIMAPMLQTLFSTCLDMF